MLTDSPGPPTQAEAPLQRRWFSWRQHPDRVALLGLARWQAAAILGVGAYVFTAILLFGVAFRYLCLGAVVIGLAASGRANATRFLRDWFPLLLFWVGYDWMRDYADEIMPRVAVTAPYNLELQTFGWMAGGRVAAMYFLELLADSPWRPLVRSIGDAFYWSHFIVIPGYMLWLWWKPPTAVRFCKFVYGITLLNVLTLATYFLYPAAPPWYVFYFGFQQPSAALLQDPAFFHGPVLFKRVWAANPNWFAAIPSLHGAYPIFLLLMVEPKWRQRWLAALYATCVWLATVVLGHHYIIDLVLGALYAWFFVWVVDRFMSKAPSSAAFAAAKSNEERSAT